MVLPTGAKSFAHAMQIGAEIYHSLKSVTKKQYGQDAVNVGDEGGFAPPIQSNKEGIELLMNAIEKSGHLDKVVLGMDVASSEFHVDGKYDLQKKTRNASTKEPMLSRRELADFYKDLCKKFPIRSIEDPFDQVSTQLSTIPFCSTCSLLQSVDSSVLCVTGNDAFPYAITT
jgi:enolase